MKREDWQLAREASGSRLRRLFRGFDQRSRRAEIDNRSACRLARLDGNDDHPLPWLGQLLKVPRVALLPSLPARDVRVGIRVVASLQPIAPGGQVIQSKRAVGGYECLAPRDRGVECDDPDLARHAD